MAILHVERLGGLAGFGGTGARIRSHGEIDTAAFSPAELRAVESLFRSHGRAKASSVRDGFRYRISRTTSDGVETIEAPEAVVPEVLAQCVKDELI
jgi:hypothetical protein